MAGFAALAGVVAILIVVIKNPPPPPGSKTSPGGILVKPDKKLAFGPRQDQILALAQQFVLTAVRRNHVEDSWEMVCPQMRQGYSKQSWAKGDIPVVPYPANFAKWHLSYSVRREIDLQVALYAKPEKKLNPVVFDLTLQPCGASTSNRWLVSSFIPTPRRAGTSAPPTTRATSTRSRSARGTRASSAEARERGLACDSARDHAGDALIALGIVGIHGYRGKRAYNQYVRERRLPGGPTI
jgi:hypothetical protein